MSEGPALPRLLPLACLALVVAGGPLVAGCAAVVLGATAGAGTLVAFIQYIRRFFVPIRDLSTKYTVLQSAFASAERIFQLLDERVTIGSDTNAAAVAQVEREVQVTCQLTHPNTLALND